MKLRAESAAMTVLLAVLVSMGPLATDVYLPSLPWIALDLGASDADAQLTLSVFMVGFAAGQIVYGPISDRFGRKPVLLVGLGLFVFATGLCAIAQSIELLIAARFCQAIGACAAVVIARAIVRDLFAAEHAARIMSYMGALMGAVPAVAPLLGGVLQAAFGWRSSFIAVALAGVAIIVAVVTLLPETNRFAGQTPRTFSGLFGSFGVLLRNAVYRRYVGSVAFCFAGLFAFISGSSFLFQGFYGFDVVGFGFVFAVAVLGYIAGTLLGARMTTGRGINWTLILGAWTLLAGGLSMVVLVYVEPSRYWHVLAPMTIYMAGCGLTLPQAMAGALTPFPERAGAASSLLGFCQMSFAALVGIVIGQTLEHGPLVLGAVLAGLSALNFAAIFKLQRTTDL